jgi:hypothetical protein
MDERKEVALHGFRRLKEEILDEGSKKRWIKYKKGNSKGQVALLTVKHIKSNPDKYEPISSKSPEVRAKLRGKSASSKAKASKKVAPKKKAATKKVAKPVAGKSKPKKVKSTHPGTKVKSKGKYAAKSAGLYKPDKWSKMSGASEGYIPDLDILSSKDVRTRAVRQQLEQGRGFFSFNDKKGNTINCDSHKGQLLYMQQYSKGFLKGVQDKGNFGTKEEHAAMTNFAKKHAEITAAFAKAKTPEHREKLAKEIDLALESSLVILSKNWESGMLKDFSEFVEHNRELLLGQENYMPSAGNFEVGDKVKVERDKGTGEIVRLEHGSFKTESSVPKQGGDDKVVAGAAPSMAGELHAVTFFKNEKRDAKFKEETDALFRDSKITAAEFNKKYQKILTDNYGKKDGAKRWAAVKKERADHLKNDKNKYDTKRKNLTQNYARMKQIGTDESLQAAAEIKRVLDKLDKHIMVFSSVKPLMEGIVSANFSTQAYFFDKKKGKLFRGETDSVEGYKPHAKFSRVDDLSNMSPAEIIKGATGKKGWYDIQGANAKPIYKMHLSHVGE